MVSTTVVPKRAVSACPMTPWPARYTGKDCFRLARTPGQSTLRSSTAVSPDSTASLICRAVHNGHENHAMRTARR